MTTQITINTINNTINTINTTIGTSGDITVNDIAECTYKIAADAGSALKERVHEIVEKRMALIKRRFDELPFLPVLAGSPEEYRNKPLRFYITGEPQNFFSKKDIERVLPLETIAQKLNISEDDALRAVFGRYMPDGKRAVPVLSKALELASTSVQRLIDQFYFDPSKHIYILSFEPLDFLLISDVACFRSCHSLREMYELGNALWAQNPWVFLWMKADVSRSLVIPYKLMRTIMWFAKTPLDGTYMLLAQRQYPHREYSDYFVRVLIKRLLGAQNLCVSRDGDINIRYKGKTFRIIKPITNMVYVDPHVSAAIYVRDLSVIEGTEESTIDVRFKLEEAQ